MNRALSLPAALSLIAGATDVTSWLLLGGFFSAHVTGNLVVIGADVVTGTPPDPAVLLAVPVFVLTTILATVVTRRIGPRSIRATTALLAAQAALLTAAAALSFASDASADPDRMNAVLIGMCAVGAMATQNAYLHLVPARALSTAVMTGNVVAATVAATDFVRSKGQDHEAHKRWSGTWPLIAGFITGCLVGAAGATLLSDRAAVIPALLAVVLLIAELARRRTSVLARGPAQPEERTL